MSGTIQGIAHIIFNLHIISKDFDMVGTAHSHPSSLFYPANFDLLLFPKKMVKYI
jgi:hypothetical protein